MLDLPEHPILDKMHLVGGCVRLPLVVDAARLAAQIEALGESVWGTTGGRIGVHSAAEALFLRGHAPAQGELPIEDREVLERLPYAREVMALLPAPPQRCLLARLPPGRTIAPHTDRAPYFSKTLRVHVPVTTHELAFMLCGDEVYPLRAGEVWVLNNSTRHGVWNADPVLSRTHLICDYVSSPALLALLQRGDRSLGTRPPAVLQHFSDAAR